MALRIMYCSTRVAEHWYMANAFYGFFLYMDFDLFVINDNGTKNTPTRYCLLCRCRRRRHSGKLKLKVSMSTKEASNKQLLQYEFQSLGFVFVLCVMHWNSSFV